MEAQAVYDLPDLAAKMGMSPRRAKRYLEKSGVRVTPGGRGTPQTILLCDIRESFPDLYTSLEEAAHIRGTRPR